MKQKSFTLIEMLIVIAILGLLAAITIVNIQSSRERARIAAILEFSTSIYHGLGDGLVGYWSFDDEGNLVTKDLSGYGNDCNLFSIYGNPLPSYGDGIPVGSSMAIKFNGFQYLDCGNDSSFDITDKITIEAWVYAEEFNESLGWNHIISKADGYNLDYQMELYWGQPHFEIHNGLRSYTVTAPDSLTLKKWYHLAGTYNGSEMNLYINGESAISDFVIGPIRHTENAILAMGRMGSANNFYFVGSIDEVRLYNRAFTVGEIQKHYAEGLESHRDLASVK